MLYQLPQIKSNSFLYLLYVRVFSCKWNIHVMQIVRWPICPFITWLGSEWQQIVEMWIWYLLALHMDFESDPRGADEIDLRKGRSLQIYRVVWFFWRCYCMYEIIRSASTGICENNLPVFTFSDHFHTLWGVVQKSDFFFYGQLNVYHSTFPMMF